MTETICITVNQLALFIFFSTIAGFMISTLVLKYYFVRRRARRMSPAQADLDRLAEYIATNHSEYVKEGSVADIAIKMIDVLHKQKAPL